MVEGGGGTGLAAESFKRLCVSGQIVGQEFQGNKATELGILGLINHTHPAATELFDDAVVGNCLADHGFHQP
jgi:hypothetical protein